MPLATDRLTSPSSDDPAVSWSKNKEVSDFSTVRADGLVKGSQSIAILYRT